MNCNNLTPELRRFCRACNLINRKISRIKRLIKRGGSKICDHCNIKKGNFEYWKNNSSCKECIQKIAFEGGELVSNVRSRNRKKNDPAYKLHKIISSFICQSLKKEGGSKCRKSIKNFLNYTIDDLVIHLEKQFEPWMNWDNWGVYKTNEWNDNDPSTWVWHIDHKIAKTKLPFSSMSEPNFLKCWGLDNLRPYSAKQNIIDGNRR